MSERLVFVYKSHNKQGRYLYLKEKDVFSHIPAALLDAFGTPEFVMMFALSKHKTLPKVSVEDLDKALEEKGYKVEITEFSDYVQPNNALADKEIDVSMFQHSTYLKKFSEQHGLDLTYISEIPTAGMAIFSNSSIPFVH